jgi:hypothetical protein
VIGSLTACLLRAHKKYGSRKRILDFNITRQLLTTGDDDVKSKQKWVALFAISGMCSMFYPWQMFHCPLTASPFSRTALLAPFSSPIHS